MGDGMSVSLWNALAMNGFTVESVTAWSAEELMDIPPFCRRLVRELGDVLAESGLELAPEPAAHKRARLKRERLKRQRHEARTAAQNARATHKRCPLSEDYWCAGWLMGLEFTLWEMLEGGDKAFGLGFVSPEEIAELRRLRDGAGGWVVFDDDLGECAVTDDEWAALRKKA